MIMAITLKRYKYIFGMLEGTYVAAVNNNVNK